MLEVGGCNGRHLGSRCLVVGGWRSALLLVLDRSDQCTAGRTHFHRCWLSATGKKNRIQIEHYIFFIMFFILI